MKSEWEWIEEKCSCFHTRSNTDMLQWTISAQMCAFCLTYILQLCVVIFKPLYPLKIKQKHGELLIEKTFYEKLRRFFQQITVVEWLVAHQNWGEKKIESVCVIESEKEREGEKESLYCSRNDESANNNVCICVVMNRVYDAQLRMPQNIFMNRLTLLIVLAARWRLILYCEHVCLYKND